MAAAIRLHKTNQPFDWPTVSDGIQVFEQLGLSGQKELFLQPPDGYVRLKQTFNLSNLHGRSKERC